MKKITKKLINILEGLGWNFNNNGNNQFSIERWASNGKDIYYDITVLNDFDFFKEIEAIYNNFDVDDEVKINIDCNGAPSISQILEDCKEEENELEKLKNSICDLLLKRGELE